MGRCVRIEGEVLRRAQEFGVPETEAGALVASLPLAYKIAKYFGLKIEDVFCLEEDE